MNASEREARCVGLFQHSRVREAASGQVAGSESGPKPALGARAIAQQEHKNVSSGAAPKERVRSEWPSCALALVAPRAP
eukprot:scaffold10273_cov122-Isochrysis_galbana.AAC.5